VPAFHFIHPGDLSTRTGGYRYARELLAALERRGFMPSVHRLADSFPFPDAPALNHAADVLAGIPDGNLVVVDGLALGAMPAQVAAHGARLKLVALVHHPLALEKGLCADEVSRLAASERAALAWARAVVVTSPATAAALGDYDVPAALITVVLPGTERVRAARRRTGPAASLPSASTPAATGPAATTPAATTPAATTPAATTPAAITPAAIVATATATEPMRLLCVASVTPRKGHLDLVEALAACRARNPEIPWRLLCIGSLERDPGCAAAVADRIRSLGLDERVRLAGEHDEAGVDRAYAESDVFVLASHHEGYGMVLAEAMAHGLPIVSTTAGAIPDTVPPGAGLLVEPGNVGALAAALERVLTGQADMDAMAASAGRAAADLPDWDAAAEGFIGVLRALQDDFGAGSRVAGSEETDAAGGHPDPLSFAASWLALREPHDHAARADELTQQLCRYLRSRSADSDKGAIRVLDLACGTGSSLRYLAPRLGASQHWTMVDRDPALLARLCGEERPQVAIEPVCLDLVEDLERLPLAGVDLITASALLDLVSAGWLERLVAAVLDARKQQPARSGPPALLFALSYDGSVIWQPALPEDGAAVALFNRHQRSDKGFGPALGPSAAGEAALQLQAAGFTVTQASSTWRLGPADTAIQREFLAGIAGAAATLASESTRVQAWLQERLALVDRGHSAVEVGHQDVLAVPPRLPDR